MNGWADLGAALTGGGQVYEQAYGQALTRRARTEAALAGARKARDEEAARMQLGDALMGAGMTPEQATMISTTFRGGFNPEQATGSMLDMQRQSLIDRATGALSEGDMDLGNNLLRAVQGKPSPRTVIHGNTAYDPLMTPDKAMLTTTDIGQSMIRENDAQAQSSLMRGEAAVTRANAPKAVKAEDEVLAQARERIAAGADPKAVAEYLRNKGYPDVAAQLYEPTGY